MKGWLDKQIDRYVEKAMPGAVGGGMPGLSPTADAFRKRMQPTRRQLLDSLRGFSYACVDKNASAVAQNPIRLYLRTDAEISPVIKSLSALYDIQLKDVSPRQLEYLREHGSPHAQQFVRKFAAGNQHKLKEITDNHQVLDVLRTVNPYMNQYDLFYMTQFELDVEGEAYWFPAKNVAGGVGEVWPLEAWRMRPVPSVDGKVPLKGWEYMGQRGSVQYTMDQLIQFRYVSPHDPYATGFSPIRACFEYVELANELHAYETAVVNNRARPDLMITPKETISRGMAMRLEQRMNERFRRGGAGGVLVGEYGYQVQPFAWSPVDMGNVAMRKACEDIVAACLGIPLSLVRADEINRATAEAGHYQHAKLAVRPRCVMLEQKLNERFIPLFDAKLLLAFDNPVPEDAERQRADRQANIACGVTSINEEREKEGLDPVKGGEEPLISPGMIPLSRLAEMVTSQIQAQSAAGPVGQMKPGGQPGAEPGMSKKRYRLVRSQIDDAVRKAIEEDRLARMGDASSVWPDMVFQGDAA